MKEMQLYHGSYCIIRNPSLHQCADGKDFGKGFYLTTSRSQAERFCRTSVGKALKNGKITEPQAIGFVSVFRFVPADNLTILEFTEANDEWLRCVGAHRKKALFKSETDQWKSYDIITGKIANDTTNRVITNYIHGDYGFPEDRRAIEFAISLLKPEKLSDQECFRTNKALACLHFTECYEVPIQ